MREQGMRPVAQNLGERIGEVLWLNQLDDVSVSHGVSLLGGEVEALKTPTIRRLTPSCRHQLSRIALKVTKQAQIPMTND
jgi:hypothetical protein